ncbi:MAG: hypothetical protein C0624_04005 [Desulfuromonas sp.]|nr:MAG: hypothetical protein C0624_04005 [Desulfuromonas sp.]
MIGVLKIFFLLILFLVIFFVSSILSVFFRLLGGPRRQPPREKSSQGEDMVRDPQCGMFLPRQDALSVSIKGVQHHFCSTECRDAFKRSA